MTDQGTTKSSQTIPINDLFQEIEAGHSRPALLDRYVSTIRQVTGYEPTPDELATRLLIPDLGVGEIYNTRLQNDQQTQIAFDADFLHVQIRRRGRYTTSDASGDMTLLQGAELMISASRAGIASTSTAKAGDVLQMIVIHMRPSAIEKALNVKPHMLPQQLATFFKPRTAHHVNLNSVSLHYVLPDKIGRALDDALDCTYEGQLHDRYLLAKVMECLIDCFALLQMPETLAAKQSFVSKSMRPFEQAHAILREHYRNPPNLDDIAQAVGVSRRKLTAGYRAQYGQSPMTYALQLRMEEAQKLLRAGDIQIAQIAYRVGYQQPANFTQAYKSYFGYPPKEEK